jgi:uncharacterized protein YdcH (DUF465 family)
VAADCGETAALLECDSCGFDVGARCGLAVNATFAALFEALDEVDHRILTEARRRDDDDERRSREEAAMVKSVIKRMDGMGKEMKNACSYAPRSTAFGF